MFAPPSSPAPTPSASTAPKAADTYTPGLGGGGGSGGVGERDRGSLLLATTFSLNFLFHRTSRGTEKTKRFYKKKRKESEVKKLRYYEKSGGQKQEIWGSIFCF